MRQDTEAPRESERHPRRCAPLAAFAVGVLVVAAGAQQGHAGQEGSGRSVPPAAKDAPEARSEGPKFDHSAFNALLRKHVDADGWVDYAALKKDEAALDAYVTSLKSARLANMGRDERLALLINAYNAFTLRLILDYYPVDSIKDIWSWNRWSDRRWHIGSQKLSLDQIEHEEIRPKFKEPRIHFALVCAAIGCPKLRNEAFQAVRLDEQLEGQARYVHTHERWFRYRPGAKQVFLTKLYDWYDEDFERAAGSVLNFAARYSESLRTSLNSGAKPKIKWLDYDWKLNDAKNKR